ncbi:MAG: FAD-dependent oxidoreductase [Thermodesulfobacteriota bacterium]
MTEPPAQDGMERAVLDQAEAQLRAVLGRMPREVSLLLFTSATANQVFSDAFRQVLRAIRTMAPKVSLREFDLGHPKAREHEVTAAPTLILAPDRAAIRWLGAPLGEEGRVLVEALLMLGYGDLGLAPESERILAKLSEPRQVTLFVSPTCPYCPQQAVNALKAALARPDLISLSIVDIQIHPALADRYDAHSVPQVWANDVLIARGAQPEELFMTCLSKLQEETVFIPESDAPLVEADLVIVGGGPAGLTAGIYGARAGLKTVVIEKDALGGQVATTPVVENYPGFTQVGGKTLVDIMVSHALQYVQIFPGEAVLDIVAGQPLEVATSRRRFQARAVLLATGAGYRHLGVPGEARLGGRGVSYCATCDGALFRDRDVAMVGGGNSALTEALYLQNVGARVTIIHRRDRFRAQEHLVQAVAAAGIPILFQHEVEEILGEGRVEAVRLLDNRDGSRRQVPVQGVFIAIGYQPAVELAKKIGAGLTPDGYLQQDERHRTTVPGVYAAGDVAGGARQIVTAAGQGAEAAMAIFEDLVHPYWTESGSA